MHAGDATGARGIQAGPPCGHTHNGKAAEAYRSFAQGLARQGYVCLIYDPIGQGERLQYVREDLSSRHGAGVGEHLHAGNQQFLVGEFLGMGRAWDGIRALDYLLSRKEVDPQHVWLVVIRTSLVYTGFRPRHGPPLMPELIPQRRRDLDVPWTTSGP